MRKGVKVTAVQQHILEFVRKAPLQVASEEHPLAVTTHPPDQSRTNMGQQVVEGPEAIHVRLCITPPASRQDGVWCRATRICVGSAKELLHDLSA
eukprot:3731375-Prymnesium_polylepis.1